MCSYSVSLSTCQCRCYTSTAKEGALLLRVMLLYGTEFAQLPLVMIFLPFLSMSADLYVSFLNEVIASGLIGSMANSWAEVDGVSWLFTCMCPASPTVFSLCTLPIKVSSLIERNDTLRFQADSPSRGGPVARTDRSKQLISTEFKLLAFTNKNLPHRCNLLKNPFRSCQRE